MGILSKITTIIIVIGTVLGFNNTQEPAVTSTENQTEISSSIEETPVQEEEPEVMANGDFDWSEYIDEEELKRQEYDSRSIDEILEDFEEYFNSEIDKAIEEVFYESLDPYEQFVYGLQYSLGSYTDSVYKQYYGNSTDEDDYYDIEEELNDYFTDLYDYEHIFTEEDLISSVENSRFRNVCDKTIGEAIYGNLKDVQRFVQEDERDPAIIYVTYTGIDKETDEKYTIKFEVINKISIGVYAVYRNNRAVGSLEDVLEAVEYVLR